jgi:uncharacterized protein (DUF58 family)
VHNETDRPLVDLRVIDGVPEALPVVAGTPRASLTLDPSERQTVEYQVELQRGEHTFGRTSLRTRDITGTTTVDWSQSSEGDQTVRCSPAVTQAPVGRRNNEYGGDVPTDEGGRGIVFHSVREYEPGDSMHALDWRRYANTRDLASIRYQAERSARVLCVVDTRQTQFRSPAGSELSVAELTADAADRTVRRLLDDGHPTGVATMGTEGVDIVSPGTGTEHRARISAVLTTGTNGAVSPEGPDQEIPTGKGNTPISQRLHETPEIALQQTTSNTTHLFLFSGFFDEKPLDVLTQLCAQGYNITVISPSAGATADTTDLSTRLVELDRQNRLSRARTAGGRVLEWDLDESIGTVLNRAIEGVNSQ